MANFMNQNLRSIDVIQEIGAVIEKINTMKNDVNTRGKGHHHLVRLEIDVNIILHDIVTAHPSIIGLTRVRKIEMIVAIENIEKM